MIRLRTKLYFAGFGANIVICIVGAAYNNLFLMLLSFAMTVLYWYLGEWSAKRDAEELIAPLKEKE